MSTLSHSPLYCAVQMNDIAIAGLLLRNCVSRFSKDYMRDILKGALRGGDKHSDMVCLLKKYGARAE
jgi:hypothetical protein